MAISRHESLPGADRGRRRDRSRGPFEQSPHRRLAETLPGLAQRRGGGHVPVPFPRGDEPQPADHLAHHFFVGLAEKQRQRDHVIDDQPGRQQAVTLFLAARFGDYLIDQVTSINARNHAQAQVIRQPARPWLLVRLIHQTWPLKLSTAARKSLQPSERVKSTQTDENVSAHQITCAETSKSDPIS